ncbi:MAG: GGDEF domain-containing protein, partial [Gammaproteobacteria bacterium]|nr:GGDEF domain-containing protein [Gammaproteobacteria bacterium]
MNQMLPAGLNWTAWLAIGGSVVFCLLGLYAGLLFHLGKSGLGRAQKLIPATLRNRVLGGFILVAILPTISLALVLTERNTIERLDHAAALLETQTRHSVEISNLKLAQINNSLGITAKQVRLADPTGAHDLLTQVIKTLPYISRLQITDLQQQVLANATQSPANKNTLFKTALTIPITDAKGLPIGQLEASLSTAFFETLWQGLKSRSGHTLFILDEKGALLHQSESIEIPLTFNPEDPTQIVNFAGLPTRMISLGGVSDNPSHLVFGERLLNGWTIFQLRPLSALETAIMQEYGVALAWLIGALLIAICLAIALVSGLSGPLESLDRSIRNFDLHTPQPRPTPPAGAPREVTAIFDHLVALDKRLRATYRKLRKALSQGEKLRGELIYVISNREKEIEKQTAELKEANTALKRLSREDSLTGLANRRWFAEFLARSWRVALRENKPLSILIMDIDNFKSYNDSYGHQKGDECLRQVAKAIRLAIGRPSDLASRYGGEEFVVVLGDTPLEGALKVAESIRQSVRELEIPHKGSESDRYVTLSIGVTSTLPTHDVQPETILIAADRAMYNAKSQGKNRVAYSTTARTGTYQA